MIEALHIFGDKVGVTKSTDPTELQKTLNNFKGLLWVNIVGTPKETTVQILQEVFHFHPLAIEDAIQEKHVPKVDDWDDYLYISLRAPHPINRDESIELDIFFGRNYMVTYSRERVAGIENLWETVQGDHRLHQKGASGLLYRIVDALTDEQLAIVDKVDLEIERIEEQVFNNPDQAILEDIFEIKRILLHLKRIIAPQREVLGKMARGDFKQIPKNERIFFRDMYDHYVRLYDLNESLREIIQGVLDTYLSAVNNKMNEVMKILVIVTALFLPLSFLTGFFGMNFFQPTFTLDAWTGRIVFGIILILMVTLPVGMLIWIKRKNWL